MFFGKRFSGYRKGTLSGLDILVLSIIKNSEGVSGYVIIQKINKKFKDLWKASAGTIYPLLNRLAEKELVKIEEITENNRHKKIYKITENGNDTIRKTLNDNLRSSIDSLGDYIKTVIKAIPFDEKITHCFSCSPFPFPDFFQDEEMNAKNMMDYSLGNLKRIERIIKQLKSNREKLRLRLDKMDEKINEYELVLKNIKQEREKNAKTIKIVDDDEEFENF